MPEENGRMKVSVRLTTYNHEKFISQAIDSALMQKVNFDYEIVIGEDCSTDSTRKIVIDYQKKNPEKIRLLLPEKNYGMIRNSVEALQACRGEYVALLEGDDYWTSPYKLQRQVDFMDMHSDYALCFHPVEMIYEDNVQFCGRFWGNAVEKDTIELSDLFIYDNLIPTCSVVRRRGIFDCIPKWFYKVPYGDWVSHLISAQYGKIGRIDEVMAAYRLHSNGAWTSLTELNKQKKRVENHRIVGKHLGLDKKTFFRKAIAKHLVLLAIEYEGANDLLHARRAALEGFLYNPLEKRAKGLKTLLRLTYPRLFQRLKSLKR